MGAAFLARFFQYQGGHWTASGRHHESKITLGRFQLFKRTEDQRWSERYVERVIRYGLRIKVSDHPPYTDYIDVIEPIAFSVTKIFFQR